MAFKPVFRKTLSKSTCSFCGKIIKRKTETVMIHGSRKHRRLIIMCQDCLDITIKGEVVNE